MTRRRLMADTNRGGASPSYHDLDGSSNTCSSTTHELVQKRTRSQLNVSDSTLRLPRSRSPVNNARKARTKAQAMSPMLQPDSRLHTPQAAQSPTVERGGVEAGMNVVIEADTQEPVRSAEGEEMEQRHEEGEGSENSLFGGRGCGEDLSENQSRDPMPPTSAMKRASPDTDAMRTPSSPGIERQSKRAKVDAFLFLGRRQEHSEYREPLRDPDAGSPGRPKGHKRASSMKPMSSPRKEASFIFPSRAQSVPPGGNNEIPAVDFTLIPPSPRRSPSRGAVEVRRAVSVPPPDEERMDVDAGDASALLQFTNATRVTTPRANPVFRYTVNFATPRGSGTPSHSGFPFTSPLSPLTPLPPSPPMEFLPEMQKLLAKKASAKLLALSESMDSYAEAPGSPINSLMADTPTSTDIPQSTTHVPRRSPSAASTAYPATAVPGSSDLSQSRLARPPLTLSNLTELMPPASKRETYLGWTVNVAGGPVQAESALSNNPDGAGMASTSNSIDSSTYNPRSSSNDIPSTRPSVIGAMKAKRGPSIPQGSKRVTRSVSMKEQRVKGERAEIEDAGVEIPPTTTSTVAGPSSEVAAMPPPSSTVVSKPRPLRSIGALASKSKSPLTTHRSTSLSKLPPDNSKMKQMSLRQFVKGKTSATGVTATAVDNAVSTSMCIGTTSRLAPPLSPSKIPLPTSPSKRPSSQHANAKPFLSSLGFTSTGAGASRGASGRSLSTLSHALDKLAAPPPSRPNTSMGFIRGDESSEDEGSSIQNSKGKEKSKDDASLPSRPAAQASRTTFARPTASSLKRAATVTGFGATAASRMRGRGGLVPGVAGRGRGTIGIFGKAGDRASKKTSLPVVAGSPVKGSGIRDDLNREDWANSRNELELSLGSATGIVTGDEDVFMSQDSTRGNDPGQDAVMQDVSVELLVRGSGSAASQKPSPPTVTSAGSGTDINVTTSPISADKRKQRAVSLSTLNPASSALHALSESLSSLPQTPTPPKPRVAGTRTGLRSSTAAAGKESPSLGGSDNGVPSEVHGSGGAGPSNQTVNGSGGAKKSTLRILKRCTIFVDVRTEQGDDAGSLFVDMLKGLGAKIMTRLGQTCTHIIYKNGLPNTLARYRMLIDPKPFVVGIAWVVECVEKRAKVDEERFKIDVDMINVAGGNLKRRRSMHPKHLIPASPGPDFEIPLHMSSEADEDDKGMGHIDGSPSQDLDLSIRSREEDDLPPLERARRRRSILPGGQTRLIP